MDLISRYPRLAELAGIDLRSLALFRVALGGLLLCAPLSAFCELALWTDAGVLPRAHVVEAESAQRLSLYLIGGSRWFVALLLSAQTVAAAMLMLGWHARRAALVSFVLWVSLLNRNPLVIAHTEMLIGGLLFWSMWLPLQARFSVDAALSPATPPQRDLHVSWASLALLLQVASVYFFAAWLQLRHADAGAASVLWWPTLLTPILLFSPLALPALRATGLALLVPLSFVLLWSDDSGLLWPALAGLSVFIGGWAWNRLAERHRRRHPGPLAIYYDDQCSSCIRSCLLFQQFLVLPGAGIAPAQDNARARTLMEANDSWVVIDADQQAYVKWAACAVLLRHSMLLGWLAPAARQPALESAGNRLYEFIVRQRPWLGRIGTRLLAQREPRWEPSHRWQWLAAAFAALLLVWNLQSVGALPAAGHARLASLLQVLRLDQHWNWPAHSDDAGWLVVAGRLADGNEIDLLDPTGDEPDFIRPRAAAREDGRRWLRYRAHLVDPAQEQQRRDYADYLCRSWNAGRDPQNPQRLLSLKMIQVLETAGRETAPATHAVPSASVEQQVLWRQQCEGA